MIREVENKKIINILETAIQENPCLRFNQILHSLNIISSEGDSFYDEPEKVLKRVEESDLYKKLNEKVSYRGVF